MKIKDVQFKYEDIQTIIIDDRTVANNMSEAKLLFPRTIKLSKLRQLYVPEHALDRYRKMYGDI